MSDSTELQQKESAVQESSSQKKSLTTVIACKRIGPSDDGSFAADRNRGVSIDSVDIHAPRPAPHIAGNPHPVDR